MMFENILVTISSEYFSDSAIKRAVELSKRFGSEITLLYVVEEKVMEMMNSSLEYTMTYEEREKTEDKVVGGIKNRAKDIFFEKAAKIAGKEDIKITSKEIEQGKYTDTILNFCRDKEEKIDLIIMSFERATLLDYEIFDWISPPLWIEKNGKAINKIIAFPSNLTFNLKLPAITFDLAERLDSELFLEYIVDETRKHSVSIEDEEVEIGKKELDKVEKKEKTWSQLDEDARRFLNECEENFKDRLKGLHCFKSKGSLEKLIVEKAREVDADLIVLGREQKKDRRVLGMFKRKIKQEIIEGIPCPILLLG